MAYDGISAFIRNESGDAQGYLTITMTNPVMETSYSEAGEPQGYLTITMVNPLMGSDADADADAFADFGDGGLEGNSGLGIFSANPGEGVVVVGLFGADCGAGEFSAEGADLLEALFLNYDASTPCTPIKTATGATCGFFFGDISSKPFVQEMFGSDCGAGENADAFVFVLATAEALTDMAVEVIGGYLGETEKNVDAAREAWDHFDDFAWFDEAQAQAALADLF